LSPSAESRRSRRIPSPAPGRAGCSASGRSVASEAMHHLVIRVAQTHQIVDTAEAQDLIEAHSAAPDEAHDEPNRRTQLGNEPKEVPRLLRRQMQLERYDPLLSAQ